MKRNLSWILLALVFTLNSCGKLSITPNEDKGIKEVLNFYGGECKYSKGASVSTEKGKQRYFELEMSKITTIEEFMEVAELPASNIAYLFYKNLRAEREHYDEIHVVIDNGKGKSFEMKYPKPGLDIVEKKVSLMNTIARHIQDKNFDAIKQSISENPMIALTPIKSKNNLVDSIIKGESLFGTIKSFEPFGFQFRKTREGRNILHLSGLFVRAGQNTQFSVDLDANPKNDDVLYIDYRF